MNDDYVLKYIPVMTGAGKIAHFGEPTLEDEAFDPGTAEEQAQNDYLALVKKLSSDEELNSTIDKLLESREKPTKFDDFKMRLARVIAKTKIALYDTHKKHRESTTTQVKKDTNSMRQSMEKIVFPDLFKAQLQGIVQERLHFQHANRKSERGSYKAPPLILKASTHYPTA